VLNETFGYDGQTVDDKQMFNQSLCLVGVGALVVVVLIVAVIFGIFKKRPQSSGPAPRPQKKK